MSSEALPVGSEERKKALSEIPDWTEVEGRDAIFRKFVFANFDEAWAWMNKVAKVAAEDDHHPEWFNVYNRVEVTLATHVYHGLSVRDIKLAKACDDFFQNR
jgi:4a-hydroxytetrahydrobiopterin dehydratase